MSATQIHFTRVTSTEPTARGLRAVVEGAGPDGTVTEVLEVDAVSADVLRLRMSVDGMFDERPTHATCVDPLSQSVTVEVGHHNGSWQVSTGSLTLHVRSNPFSLNLVRSDGSAVLQTFHDAAHPGAVSRVGDGFRLARVKSNDDGFYGLGEKGGSFDRNGRDFTMWNTDVLNPDSTRQFREGRAPDDPRAHMDSTEFDPYYVNIPMLYHHPNRVGAMGGSFIDNGYRGFYDFTAQDHYSVTFDGGQWNEYVFGGPSMPQILQDYTWLTGRVDSPPQWSLGFHQCRWKVYHQADIEALADRFEAENIPCDALWLDIEYMDGYRVFTWDRDRFPEPRAMLDRLAAQGIRVVSIIDPGVKAEPGYPVYDDGLDAGVFCRTPDGDTYIGQVWPGDTAFPDFATPQAREWWGALNAAHVESGLSGIWNDMNEPATGSVPEDGMWFEGGTVPHGRYHNQYALLMAMATWDGLEAARPGEAKFILSRAGFAGIQRYAATWMGDNQSRWDHLAVSIPMACGLGVSGQPFVGADCGGFQGDSNAELYQRWMQMGALTPFFRSHTEVNTADQYPWSFGPAVLSRVRAAIELRYRLMPYIREAFERAGRTGEPVQRPYVFDHQDDPVVAEVEDAYLFGSDLVVAPATEPGQLERRVYLPAGTWRAVSTGEVRDGRQWLTVALEQDTIPLFVRDGSGCAALLTPA